MKQQHYTILLAVGAFFCLTIACNDPTFIGSDLVEQDAIDVEFTDEIAIEATTVRLDSVRTFTPETINQLSAYLCGQMRDPFFGTTTAQIFAQLGIQFSEPDLVRSALDSMVLVLPYDTTAFYNRTSETYGFEVLRVVEPMDSDQRYFSDRIFATDPMPLAQVESRLRTLTADTVTAYSNAGTPNRLAFPHLRIHLNADFAEELLTLDQALYQNDSTFINYLAGINIRPTTENTGMPAFNLRSSNAGLFLYYNRADTLRQFAYPFKTTNVRMVNIEHDYSGTPVESFINNAELSDSLLFVQAAAGLNVELTFPDLSKFEGVVVNKAVLEFKVADLSSDGADIYPPVQQFLALYENSSGNLVTVPEISNAVFSNTDYRRTFGGTVARTKDGEGWRYELNLSKHFQSVIDGTAPNTITIQAFPNPERASRVGLHGVGSSDATRVRMQLTFTRL